MKKYKCTVCKKIKNKTEFHKNNYNKNNIRSDCIKCCKEKSLKYYSTENGFMSKLYSSMKDRTKVTKRSMAHVVELSLKEFLEEWEKHKKKHGMTCCYTGVQLDFIKKKGRGTQVSVDRLDNNIGYTKDNIVFCSSRANFEKHSVTIDMCRKILALYKERQGVDKNNKIDTMKEYEPKRSYRTATLSK